MNKEEWCSPRKHRKKCIKQLSTTRLLETSSLRSVCLCVNKANFPLQQRGRDGAWEEDKPEKSRPQQGRKVCAWSLHVSEWFELGTTTYLLRSDFGKCEGGLGTRFISIPPSPHSAPLWCCGRKKLISLAAKWAKCGIRKLKNDIDIAGSSSLPEVTSEPNWKHTLELDSLRACKGAG